MTGVRELGPAQEGLRANTAPGQAPAMRPGPCQKHQPPGKQPSLFEAQEAPMAERVGVGGWGVGGRMGPELIRLRPQGRFVVMLLLLLP